MYEYKFYQMGSPLKPCSQGKKKKLLPVQGEMNDV